MRKILLWIKANTRIFAVAFTALSLIGILVGGWFLLVPAVICGLTAVYTFMTTQKPYKPADNKTWRPSRAVVARLVPEIFIHLRANGYAKGDYSPDRHDCDDYTVAGIHTAHDLFLQHIPEGHGLAIYPFSFRRENGKRHRLFFIIDDVGIRHYVENYPVFDEYHSPDGFYRWLTTKEELNGYLLS